MAASKLTNEDKLKRIIYFGVQENSYHVVANFESLFVNKDAIEILNECFKTDPTVLLTLITTANSDKNLPRRQILFYLLARAINYENTPDKVKPKITDTVLKICKSDADFFDFVKFTSKLRVDKSIKLSPAVKRIVKKFYSDKTPQQLVESYAKFNRYHSWSHKDLIKLAHLKSESPLKNVVVNYILFKKAHKDNVEEGKLVGLLEKSRDLRSTKEHVHAVPLISELKATIKQVCPDLQQCAPVWSAVIENMSVQEILPHLGKMYKLGFLKANSPTQAKVTTAITSQEKIKYCGIHPMEVFICMKTFEKGGKPRDPKLLEHLEKDKKLTEEDLNKIKTRHEPKCPIVINSLQKCFNVACSNLTPTNKRYLITIDVTEKAISAPCIGNKVLNSVEAAVAYATILLRLEKDVVVATYCDKDIKMVQLEKRGTFAENLTKVLSQKSAYALINAPLEWAANEKKHFDVFINFIHHAFSAGLPEGAQRPKPGFDTLLRYRKKVNLPNSKLVTFCLTAPNFTTSCNDVPNVLEVIGFDVGACKAVDAFCKGTVS